jgi:hypothetical protein
MTVELLLAEGRRLQRDCYFLKPFGTGEPVAMWFEADSAQESVTGWRCWLTIRSDSLPCSKAPKTVFLSVSTNGLEHGVIDLVDRWPQRNGTPLYPHVASVLPPIDAVFAKGSEEVGEWLKANNWSRIVRYNGNFPEANLVEAYERVWFTEHPIYRNDPDIYVATGGWHLPGQDNDWHALIPAKLLLTTIRDSEPWVEVFQMSNGDCRVIQRIT